MLIHDVKIAPNYFKAIVTGVKNFEIRKNDRNYQVDDFLLLKEYKEGKYTGAKILKQITFISEYEQKDNYIVMSLKSVPDSFSIYVQLTKKEKEIFKAIITHYYFHGFVGRDVSNTFWEIIHSLIGDEDLTENDRDWYINYWKEPCISNNDEE